MKIICIVPQLSQPRCIRRINALIDSGYELEVFGIDNGLYSNNIKDIKCNVNKNLIDKNKTKFNSLKTKIKLIKLSLEGVSKNDIIYIFGIEFALYYKIFLRKNKYIYEQGDLNYTKLKNKYIVYFFKKIDILIIKKSLVTVLTSKGFVDYLFKTRIPKNVCVLPNKLNHQILKFPICENKSLSKIVFGFVGLIRYPRTIFTFANVIGSKFPEYEFHFWGDGNYLHEVNVLCDKYHNLYYHGSFNSPSDLPYIYNSISYNVVCYDPNSLNVRIAEPNKLYESIYFRVPIIVSKGTFLEKRVNELGVGVSIDAFDEISVEKFLKEIKKDNKLYSFVSNMNKISRTDLLDSNKDLINLIGAKLNELK